MSNLSIFHFHNNQINTFIRNNEIWFLANDICKILDFKNPRTAVSNHCKLWGVLKQDTPTNSGIQSMVYINEPNLYRLVVKSRKPEAEEFERKVFEEILPSIRKTGTYSLTLSKQQQYLIKEAVIANVAKTGRTYQAVYRSLFAKFNVPRYQDILAKDFDAAIKYLESMPDAPEPVKVVPNMQLAFSQIRDGRWLVIVENDTVTHIKNINNCNCVDAGVLKKLRMQTKQQAEYLVELAYRMRVIDGDCDYSRLDVPIEESHPSFII